MIFIDANVLLDLFGDDESWRSWSARQVGRAKAGTLLTNHVVLAEAASVFPSAEDAVRLFGDTGIKLIALTTQASLFAGRAHRAYRRIGGQRRAILADFLIGGHALAVGATLVTRDRGRFSSYFPDLALITPETHP